MASINFTGPFTADFGLCGVTPSRTPVITGRQEVFHYLLTGDPTGACPRVGVRVVTAGNVETWFDEANAAMPLDAFVLVKPPARVEICGPIEVAGAAPADAAYLTCAGGTATAPVGQAVQTVPHPDAVQRVMICQPEGTNEREVSLWCDPVTGAQVTVVSFWPTSAPPGTPPSIEAYQLDGSAYPGAVAALVKCPGLVGTTTSDLFCDDSVTYTRTSFWSASNTLLVVVWQDATGAVVAQPPNPSAGACALRARVAVLFRELLEGESMDGSTVEGWASTDRIQSITLQQLAGTSTLIGADGNAITLYRSQSWSWAAGGHDQEDALDRAYRLTVNADGLVQIVVSYIT